MLRVVQPVFTDRQGRPIGDVAMEHFVLEEKPAHHPLEPLDVALKHTGLDAAYLCLQEISCLACLERNG
jgi:hypothetical protein